MEIRDGLTTASAAGRHDRGHKNPFRHVRLPGWRRDCRARPERARACESWLQLAGLPGDWKNDSRWPSLLFINNQACGKRKSVVM